MIEYATALYHAKQIGLDKEDLKDFSQDLIERYENVVSSYFTFPDNAVRWVEGDNLFYAFRKRRSLDQFLNSSSLVINDNTKCYKRELFVHKSKKSQFCTDIKLSELDNCMYLGRYWVVTWK